MVDTGRHSTTADPLCVECVDPSEGGGHSRNQRKTKDVSTVSTVSTTGTAPEGDFKKQNTPPDFTKVVEDEAERLAGHDGRDREAF